MQCLLSLSTCNFICCFCEHLITMVIITVSTPCISFSHAIGFCFDERSAALLSSRMRSIIGPRPSDYPHALSACYYFLQAVFLLALGLWSSLPARQLSLDTSYSFLTFSVFFFFFFTERIDESNIKAPTATSNCRLTTSEDAWAFFGR